MLRKSCQPRLQSRRGFASAWSAFLFAALLALPMMSLSGCKRKSSSEDDIGASTSKRRSSAAATPDKSCKRSAAPSATSLGLKPKALLKCLENMFSNMRLPDEAKKSFKKENANTYTIKDFMSVAMQVEDGTVRSMDVFFFNKLRKDHGKQPELAAQFATLAAVFPGAAADPEKGRKVFKKIDAIGRKTNKPVIDYAQDGIALNASFLPISVRYRFKPQ